MSTAKTKAATKKPKLKGIQRLKARLEKSILSQRPKHASRTRLVRVGKQAVSKAEREKRIFRLHGGGRQGTGVPIDPLQVYGMAVIECTPAEMAGCLGLSLPTFLKRLDKDKTVHRFRYNRDPKGTLREGTLKDIILTGYEEGKMSLRRMLYSQAETKPACLIFLCKNILGMRDHTAVDFQNPLTLQTSEAQDTQKQMMALPVEDLLTIREILRRNAASIAPSTQRRVLEAQGGDAVIDLDVVEGDGGEGAVDEEKAS